MNEPPLEILQHEASTDAALDLAAERGWQTVKASWYWNVKEGHADE